MGDHSLPPGNGEDDDADDGKAKKKTGKKRKALEDKEQKQNDSVSDEELKKQLGLCDDDDDDESDGEKLNKMVGKVKTVLKTTHKWGVKMQEFIASIDSKASSVDAAAKQEAKDKKKEFDASMKDLGKKVFSKDPEYDDLQELLKIHISLENDMVEMLKRKKLLGAAKNAKKGKSGKNDE